MVDWDTRVKMENEGLNEYPLYFMLLSDKEK